MRSKTGGNIAKQDSFSSLRIAGLATGLLLAGSTSLLMLVAIMAPIPRTESFILTLPITAWPVYLVNIVLIFLCTRRGVRGRWLYRAAGFLPYLPWLVIMIIFLIDPPVMS